VAKCATVFNSALGSESWPEKIKQRVSVADEQRIRRKIGRFCVLADRSGLLNGDGDFDNAADFQRLVRTHPDALGGVCDAISVLTRASTPSAMARYLRPSDYTLFTRRLCTYLPDYVSGDGHIQFTPLARRHPELLQRFCAAGFTAAYDQDPRVYAPITRGQFFNRSLGFCRDAFRTGVITYHGGADTRVHKTATYRSLLRKYFSP
jgi:hypothetical protein